MESGTYIKMGQELVPVSPSTGYWVAVQPALPSQIVEGQYLGVWTDEKDGKQYYDRSVFVADLVDALIVAKQFDQIAIWDNSKRTEVYVDYS